MFECLEGFEIPQDSLGIITTIGMNALFFLIVFCRKIFKAKELSPMTQEILKSLQKADNFKIHHEDCLENEAFKLNMFSDRFYKIEVKYNGQCWADYMPQIPAKEKKILYQAAREVYEQLLLKGVKA